MTLHPLPPVVTCSSPFQANTHLLSMCKLTLQWHHRLCSSSPSSPAFYNRSERMISRMVLYTCQSGASVTPSTTVFYALPTLGNFPMLFCHSPAIQQPACVWISFSLWVRSACPHFSARLQRRQRISPMATWMIIACPHQSMVLHLEPTRPSSILLLLRRGCRPWMSTWMI